MKAAEWLAQLVVPTNPEYDFAIDPGEQHEFANPVAVANHVLAMANAAVEITTVITNLNTKLVAAKRALADAEHAVEDFEQEILATYPAGSADRKSNKLLEAYIRQMAHDAGRAEDYKACHTQLRTAQQQVQTLEIQKQSAWQMWQLVELKGQHYQTYLSFKKHEFEQHR